MASSASKVKIEVFEYIAWLQLLQLAVVSQLLYPNFKFQREISSAIANNLLVISGSLLPLTALHSSVTEVFSLKKTLGQLRRIWKIFI